MKTCDREGCSFEAVAYIPMPSGERRYCSDRLEDIQVCETHFQEAVSKLYLVCRYTESLNQANSRQEKLIDEKHLRLRGRLAA